ncbi:adenylate/guanylate cyclase domain-containing protein [Ornithinimicrobium cavernae]|uniref:adenylate/guanylate cyclase domain-containing protein n=1 Tax=Ornithinimicrobium cavernae TaxID=2666047 RepID=UPI000D6986D7|nr:adenylate/guanylate cyclase domain-containing protein [Ornithinimicrobium cavernae]
MSQVAGSVDSGRVAAEQGRWRDAYAAFAGADPELLSEADLVAFGEAAWWTGRADESIRLRERAYRAFLARDDRTQAARVAIMLAWDHAARGAEAVYHGWMARAERLLEGLHDSAEFAYLVTVRGFNNMEGGNIEEALVDLERGEEMGVRLADREVQALARTSRGRIMVQRGEVDEGLALLDEASAAAVSGELRPFESGLIYCVTISSCQEVGDYRRAAEWTEAANHWCDQHEVTGFPGACRVHRAQVLRLRGLWSDAEVQCQAACDELRDYNRWITADGLYEIGEIRRRRGDFAAALEAYRQAAEIGRPAQPGLALLRLAEGKVDAAAAAMLRTLDEVSTPLARLALLPAQVEIALAAGDLPGARAAADELETSVARYRVGRRTTPAFDAQQHLAAGRIQLAERDWAGAVRSLRRAREMWQQVGAPYEVAQARMLLGMAYRHLSDDDGATEEFQAAEATFARLGARLDEERVKELLGRLQTRRTFLFTDIVGSTTLLETVGDEKWRRLLARHDELLRARIVEAGGEVIKQTGDGFFAAFAQPQVAVQAAVAMQRALSEEVFAPDIRIGVHTGGAFHVGGDAADYGGQGVHMAARIGAAAGSGEILVSRETLDGVPITGIRSEPRELTLKGFESPVTVVAIEWR